MRPTAVAALFAAMLTVCTADFDSDTLTLAKANLEAALNVPVLMSELTQDGFQSSFLFDNSSVNWKDLGSFQMSQIRTLQAFGNYYHLWAGFEDGSFMGYYDKGANLAAPSTSFSISYQSNENHSCATYGVASGCREFFVAAPQVKRNGAP